MAVITISRQIGTFGDKIAEVVAKNLDYKFFRKEDIEKRIVELGFPVEKLSKYDEKKPGFFANLLKDRDEYLHYLQTAILEAASNNNCVLIGRGAFVILSSAQNSLSFSLVAQDNVRLRRVMEKFSCNEKQAQQIIEDNDSNHRGFIKSFFDVNIDSASNFNFTVNTGVMTEEDCGRFISSLVKEAITPSREELGNKKIKTLLEAQLLVNKLIFTHKINIEFLHAIIEDNNITLNGIADSANMIENAICITKEEMPNYSVNSMISVAQDFKMQPK